MEETSGNPTTVRLWAAGGGDDDGLPYSALSGDEEERARALASPAIRESYLRAHALLRLALAHHTGLPPSGFRYERRCRWCGDPSHGRPTLVTRGQPFLSFSLTWRSSLCLVAICDVDVGVDAERSGSHPVPTGHQVAAPGEIEQLERSFGSPLPQGLLSRWWTAKEAVGKARGSGLIGMNGLRLVPLGTGSWCPVIDSHESWHVETFAAGSGGVASVACERQFRLHWERRWPSNNP
jgi:4'-phosphopantetheinyl transferase